MTTREQYARQLSEALYMRVGAIFSNTRRGPGFCFVCTTPAPAGVCDQCHQQRSQFGDQLADQVLPLAYVRGYLSPMHQSQHHMRAYKDRNYPNERCREDLKHMILAATYLHGRCIARAAGWWNALSFVPSMTSPGPDHPVTQLALSVNQFPGLNVTRILLKPGPSISDAGRRFPALDRFLVHHAYTRDVRAKHVILIDDTWTTGRNAQSAAMTLKAAGAAAVTVLCVGRYLNATRDDQRAFATASMPPYDPMCCPVADGACP